MGKVEESPDILRYTPQYLPWHGHITALTVAPQYRRLGLAKRLTEALERACEAQNAWFVDLFVRVSNEAIDLYRGMGYVLFCAL
jgi:N-terminal acetyltransferase B complex catalytic subunit